MFLIFVPTAITFFAIDNIVRCCRGGHHCGAHHIRLERVRSEQQLRVFTPWPRRSRRTAKGSVVWHVFKQL
jgi:hypothetical protein